MTQDTLTREEVKAALANILADERRRSLQKMAGLAKALRKCRAMAQSGLAQPVAKKGRAFLAIIQTVDKHFDGAG